MSTKIVGNPDHELTIHQQRTRDMLLMYSEWLDADEQLVDAPEGDDRTHDDLVAEFLDWLES